MFIAVHCVLLLFSSLPARFLASDPQISLGQAMHSWTGCHTPLRRLLCTSLHCVLTHLRTMKAPWCPFTPLDMSKHNISATLTWLRANCGRVAYFWNAMSVDFQYVEAYVIMIIIIIITITIIIIIIIIMIMIMIIVIIIIIIMIMIMIIVIIIVIIIMIIILIIPYEDKLMWLHHSTYLSQEVADFWPLMNTRHISWWTHELTLSLWYLMIMMMRSWSWPWWWWSWWRDHGGDDDEDDGDDDDDCTCGATSGLDGTCSNRSMRIEENQTHQAQTWTQTWSNMNQRTSLLSCGCLFPEAKAWPWCTYQRWALESKPAQCRTREGCSRLSPIHVHRIPMVL